MQSSTTPTAKAIAPAPPAAAIRQPVLQRKCACGQHAAGAECEECKKKKESGESGDPLLRRSARTRGPAGEAPSSVHNAIRYQGQPLDQPTRSRLESSFRCDLSAVRVHSDASAARAASDINARAFTLGQNIWFGQNEYSPRSKGGFHLLAHEVAHTIQQGTQTPVVQRNLAVGAVDDPAETAADRAADAALHSTSAPRLASGQPVIRRAPTGTYPSVEILGPDERRVSLDAHTHYHVKRTATPIRHTADEPAPPTVKPGADFAKAWIRVEWCQDKVRGQVDVGLDVTKQLESLAPKLLQAVGSHGDVEGLLKGTTVTPFLNVIIAQSGSYRLEVRVEADVGKDGASGERGSLKLHTQWFDLSLGASATQTPGGTTPQGSFTLTIPLGTAPETFKCKDQRKEWWEQAYLYECTKEVEPDKPDKPAPEPPAALGPQTRSVYFCYSTAEINDNKCLKSPPDPSRTSYAKLARDYQKMNEESKEGLKADFSKKYYVSEVVGYTSPEGPAGPVSGFEGNVPLAQERAKAALDFAIGPGREKGVALRGGGSISGPPSDYPLFRRAEIHLVPPPPAPVTTQPDAKEIDLRIRPDFLNCPPNVQDLAFPPAKEGKK